MAAISSGEQRMMDRNASPIGPPYAYMVPAYETEEYASHFCPKKPTEFCFLPLHSNRIDCCLSTRPILLSFDGARRGSGLGAAAWGSFEKVSHGGRVLKNASAMTVLFPTEVSSFDFQVENSGRTVQYKLDAQSNRLQNNKTDDAEEEEDEEENLNTWNALLELLTMPGSSPAIQQNLQGWEVCRVAVSCHSR